MSPELMGVAATDGWRFESYPSLLLGGRQTLDAHALDGEDAFGGTLGVIAHIAYHLEAIRQKIALIRPP